LPRGGPGAISLQVPISDTDPRIEARVIEGYRAMTPGQKLLRVQEMNEAVLELAAARIRAQYGPVSDRELRLRLAALWLDRETMIRAFGWDPTEHGY
jgi:hypothetical protein